MTDVSPEIEKLHDLAFDVTEEGWESCSATSCVSVEHAEAAVRACEQRLMTSEPGEQWVPRTMLACERQRTAREIVEALRGLAHNEFGDGHPAILEAANLIEQRFGAKKEDS